MQLEYALGANGASVGTFFRQVSHSLSAVPQERAAVQLEWLSRYERGTVLRLAQLRGRGPSLLLLQTAADDVFGCFASEVRR